jgi:hypothetical protein
MSLNGGTHAAQACPSQFTPIHARPWREGWIQEVEDGVQGKVAAIFEPLAGQADGQYGAPTKLRAQSAASLTGRVASPRTVMTAIPVANTSPAQSAAPLSCGGRPGRVHGVVSAGPCHSVCSP